MRIISLTLLLFSSTVLFGQKKKCSFAYRSITRPNSKKTQKLIATIDTLNLKSCYQVEEIPDFIINALDCWTGFDWSIANAGSPYHETGIKGPEPIPARQLMYMGLNDQYLLIAYKRGGLPLNCPTLLFKFEDKKILDVWYLMGFNEEIKSKADILQYYREHSDGHKYKADL